MLYARQVVLINPILKRVSIVRIDAHHVAVIGLIFRAELLRNTIVPHTTNRVVALILWHQFKKGHILDNELPSHIANDQNERRKDLESSAWASLLYSLIHIVNLAISRRLNGNPGLCLS